LSFTPKAERLRRDMLSRSKFFFYLWAQLPLGACAGLRVTRLDETSCEVALPGGWRTQNPFRSTYFAAQFMAAELSTGAPAVVLTRGGEASISMLVQDVRGRFVKKATGRTLFSFDDVAGMAAAIARAAASGQGETFLARPTGRMADGTVVSEFEIVWTFKRRG
jgi:Domain of unknown function (DUF4442)